MKNSQLYDVVVAGGGPAGSVAAGFLAKSGFKTVVFEKERFPRYHIGESLLPATTLGVLRKLGVQEKIENHGFPRKFGGTFKWGSAPDPWTFNFYRTGQADETLEGHPQYLHAFQVRRAEFDKILLDHAESLGAEIHQTWSVAEVAVEGDAKLVRAKSQDGATREVRARFVVDASGRTSRINRLVGKRHYDPFFTNVAIYHYWTGGERLPGDAKGNILTVAFEHGWFWYIPLSDALTSVGLVLDRNVYDKRPDKALDAVYHEMIPQAPLIAEYLSNGSLSREAPYDQYRIDLDYSYIHTKFAHQGIFLTGDAACFIDPVLSSGVHLATYSGYLAARAVQALMNGAPWEDCAREYEDLYRREYMVFHQFLVSFYEMHHDPRSYFWRARKVLDRKEGSDLDAFISIVSGQSTAGSKIFSTREEFMNNVEQGQRALETRMKRVSGKSVSKKAISDAGRFLAPFNESRHKLLEDSDPVKKTGDPKESA